MNSGNYGIPVNMNIFAVVAQFPVTLSIQNNLSCIDSVLAQTNAGDLVVFPEGSVSGYSPDPSFLGRINHLFELNTPEGKVVVGVQLCRELRFPEQWGWLARRGAQIILHLNNAVGDEAFRPV